MLIQYHLHVITPAAVPSYLLVRDPNVARWPDGEMQLQVRSILTAVKYSSKRFPFPSIPLSHALPPHLSSAHNAAVCNHYYLGYLFLFATARTPAFSIGKESMMVGSKPLNRSIIDIFTYLPQSNEFGLPQNTAIGAHFFPDSQYPMTFSAHSNVPFSIQSGPMGETPGPGSKK